MVCPCTIKKGKKLNYQNVNRRQGGAPIVACQGCSLLALERSGNYSPDYLIT